MPNYTILLIDYEPRSIERFRQPLMDAGYAVEVATDGLTGIEAFHRLSPDMVLVEAMIPKKHGFEVCQELKRTPHGRRTPVLITTGVYKGRKYRTQALHIYGCDEYIEKPIAPEQLLAVVGKFFGSAAAHPQAPEADSQAAAPAEPAAIAAGDTGMRGGTPVSVSHESAPPRPSSPKPTASSIAKDFTEEEIMARLDAILPGGEVAQPYAGPQSSVIAVAATPEPISEVPITASAEPEAPQEEPDPFLQMQAELTAELGSISAALALDPAPVFDPMPPPFPSDQANAQSVLEALPLPEADATPLRTPAEPSTIGSLPALEDAPNDPPGQLVNFDAKRSRRKKHGKKGAAGVPAPSMPAAPPERSAAQPPIAETTRPRTPVATETTLTLPAGTLVESDLAGNTGKKGVPVWVWAALVLVALVVAWFTLLRGGPPRFPASAQPTTGEAAGDPPIADSDATQSVPPRTENSNLVLNSIATPARKPAPATQSPASEPAAKRVPPGEPQTVADDRPKIESRGPIASWQPSTTTPAQAPPATEAPKPLDPPISAPAGSTDDVAGVESIVETPTPSAAPPVAPGALVDAEELDTAPVSLSRKLPMYSLQARQMRLQGTVVMKVLVNERGTVDQVVLVQGVAGADLNDSALRAAKSWTYRPATKGGVPVKTWKVEQVAFKM